MKRVLVVCAAVSALALSGCGVGAVKGQEGSGSSVTSSAASSEDSGSATDESASPAAEESPEEDSTDSMTVKFGNSYEYEDGVTLLVGEPKKFTPSEYAATGSGTKHVVVTVTVKNGSDKPYDPTLFTMTAQSGEEESEQIFDSAKGLEGSPSTKVLPGKKVTFKAGFTVKDPKDVVMEVSPGFEYDNALYTN